MPAVRSVAPRPGDGEPAVVDTDGDPPERHERFVLEPRADGISATLAGRLSTWRPAATFTAIYIVGYLVLAAAIVGLGLFLTEVLLPVDAILDADRSVPNWLEDNRNGTLTDLSYAASLAGDIPVLPILVIIAIIAGLVAKNVRVGVFLLAATLAEVTLYRLGTLAVPRDRPAVERLDVLPIDHSFPSGHVAASFVVYIGLALLITSRIRSRPVATGVWTVAIAMVVAVTVSRIYRGMHHPLDTVCGLLLGAGSLLIALIAIRAYGAVKRLRHDRSHTGSDRKALT